MKEFYVVWGYDFAGECKHHIGIFEFFEDAMDCVIDNADLFDDYSIIPMTDVEIERMFKE